MLHMQHVQRYGKMFHGQTLKSATSDYDQRHVIAFRQISVAARSWSYDNKLWRQHAIPTCPVSLCANVMSSTKPEVHNVLHCCETWTEPRPQSTCTEHSWSSDVWSADMRQDRQTYRQSHHNTLYTWRGPKWTHTHPCRHTHRYTPMHQLHKHFQVSVD